MNWALTRPTLRGVPLVRHTLPRPDPWSLVSGSIVLWTAFYLVMAAAATGQGSLLP